MSIESWLREKLWKLEALFAGAGMAGERLAAEAALKHVREHLTELGRQIRLLRCNSRWQSMVTIRFSALSMNSRARSRIPLSIGSNQSSKSWEPSPRHTAENVSS